REAAGNGLVHAPLTDLLLIDIKLDLTTFPHAATVVQKFDPDRRWSFRQRLRRRYFVVGLAEPVVLVDGFAARDIEGIASDETARGDEHAIPALLGHFDRGDDRMRSVFHVG